MRSKKVSKRKGALADAFHSWLVQNQKEVTKSAKASHETRPGKPSLATLTEAEDWKPIITSPREYQTELCERCKAKNTIVVLDTGSGKTLIAVLLLRDIVEAEMERRALGYAPKISVFLVDKVALCHQQHKVLELNLNFKIAKITGDDVMGGSSKKEFWDKCFAENNAIVCTAQVLLDCLASGFTSMQQISLLIFDEAHHAKKGHPFARIIKHHYFNTDPKERPRIMGMTASPVDTKTQDSQALRQAAAELEGMLCSEIATVSDQVLLQSLARKNQLDVVELYDNLMSPDVSKTALWDRIQSIVQNNPFFKAPLDFTKEASATLGPWVADRFWHLYVDNYQNMMQTLARTDEHYKDEKNVHRAEEAVEAVKEVQAFLKEHSLPTIQRDSLLLSSKVNHLRQVLEEAFVMEGRKRCIVFVAKRYTAVMLTDLFQQPDMQVPGMTVSYMVGSQAGGNKLANMSLVDQMLAVLNFRRGVVNCLFATTVAEEGLDIRECDVVIRFDMFNSVIQYIQSKGRARQTDSKFISMIEQGNLIDQRRLQQASQDQLTLRRFCNALPEDRRLKDNTPLHDVSAMIQHEMIGQKVHKLSSTGAQLTFVSSLAIVNHFVATLPHNGDKPPGPDYIVTSIGKMFVATIIFPDSCPLKTVSGHPQRSKQLARCSASYEACLDLLKNGSIDAHFQPIFTKSLHKMRNARLALHPGKKSGYAMRVKPELWSKTGFPAELYVTLLRFEPMQEPVLLLTREVLGEIPEIPLYPAPNRTVVARCTSSTSPIKVSPDQVESLKHFTLKIFDDVFSKAFEATAEEMPYFLTPCTALSNDHEVPSVDWDSVNSFRQQASFEWSSYQADFFIDKFVVDLQDGSRKFIVRGINQQYKPGDPTPDHVPRHQSRAYQSLQHRTIKEYSNSFWARKRADMTWRDDQAVFEADLLPLRRNLLDDVWDEPQKPTRCYIILEPLKVSSIPVKVVETALLLPAILHRVHDVLITQEACSILGLSIPPSLALEAMTKDSENTEEHGEVQMDFQAGMGRNYERLEFLGDSFLKMATTISIFTLVPGRNECQYHVERMLLICNQNLFKHALDRHLFEYVRSKSFNRRLWYPDLKLTKGKAGKSESRHDLADKSIADVCEALIGAAYLCRDGDLDTAVKAVTVMVNDAEKHPMMLYSDYYAAYKVPDWHRAPCTASQRYAIEQISQTVGYEFQSGTLLRSAFKHSSYPYESNIQDYQTLEFLGDSLLDMVVVDFLFKKYPEANPQWLTEHKIAMVSNQFLGFLCIKLNLQGHLLCTDSAVLSSITDYVENLEAEKRASEIRGDHEGSDSDSEDGEEDDDDDDFRRRPYWLRVERTPKALSDIVESLIGAMFVDSKYDYGTIERFFAAHVKPHFLDMRPYDTYASKHPVTRLTKFMQDELRCSDWSFQIETVPAPFEDGAGVLTRSEVICGFMAHGHVLAHNTGQSGRYTKVRVAKMILDQIKEKGEDQFKEDLRCDCNVRQDDTVNDKASEDEDDGDN